ncbi:MAG: DMT family transporter [Chloroflexaceae bacterium]|nr:DMT family transporter [Chloroflexaceae bacterium]NJL32898.1 DMT family transporter [Chloroflexaceae bacterium]NJO07542.1 DMT family transporter [Chloroflexaceae bacterium]
MSNQNVFPFLVLAGGILIASTAAIMIRVAQNEGMPSLTIAAGRIALASLILLPMALVRVGGELRRLHRQDVAWGVAAGVFLAIHFAAWISSLEYTSVASSAALVSTSPIWTALLAFVVLRERLTWLATAGVGLTVVGSMFIGLSDLSAGALGQYSNPSLGNMLALAGAFSVAGYFLVGRNLRRRVSVLAYIWIVYSCAAVVLVVWVALQGLPVLGFSTLAYACVIGLALGPQILGHTSFNWALRYLSATFISVALLGEPIASALLAWALFGEQFAPLQLVGFVVLLVGIYLASRNERPASTVTQPTTTDVPERPALDEV